MQRRNGRDRSTGLSHTRALSTSVDAVPRDAAVIVTVTTSHKRKLVLRTARRVVNAGR